MKIRLKSNVDNCGVIYEAGTEFDGNDIPFDLSTIEWLARNGAIEKLDGGYVTTGKTDQSYNYITKSDTYHKRKNRKDK